MDRWTVVFNNQKRVWGFSFSERLIYIIIILLGVFTGVFSYVVIEGMKNKTLLSEYSKLKNENTRYLLELENLENDISLIDSRLNKIGFNNTLFLIAGELKPVSKSVKRMGVGGFPEGKEFYSDRINRDIKEVESKIERLRNLVKLEKESLDKSADKLDRIGERLNHTPSIWPTHGWVTDGFGWRIHPITGRRQWHEGFDIANNPGTPVVATADGIVKSTKWRSGYGRTVVISHGYGFETRYAHLKNILVRPNQRVSRSQRIGSIGSTGRVTGPHLHYEVRVLGRTVDPYDYFDTFKSSY